jgi:hypothetical protein
MKQDLYCLQVHMLPICRSDPIMMQSALHSRCRGGSDEPITARTNLYTCLCIQEFNTSHLPDQVQGQVACLATPSQGVRRIMGPLTEGPGPTSSPGSLPTPRVACHCSPVGFDRQQPQTHVLGRFGALMHEFVQQCCIGTFRNELIQSTLMDPKLMFWGISDRFNTK